MGVDAPRLHRSRQTKTTPPNNHLAHDKPIRPDYHFNETCQGAVPEALITFLDADDFEHTLRLVISLGGDADTQAAIACAVAEAFWGGIPEDIETEVNRLLPSDMAAVITNFKSTIPKKPLAAS